MPWIECCSLFHAACEMCHIDEMNPAAATAGHVRVARAADNLIPNCRGGAPLANPISGSRYPGEGRVSRGVGERGRSRMAPPRTAAVCGVSAVWTVAEAAAVGWTVAAVVWTAVAMAATGWAAALAGWAAGGAESWPEERAVIWTTRAGVAAEERAARKRGMAWRREGGVVPVRQLRCGGAHAWVRCGGLSEATACS